jgi:hypothetical protein
LDLAKDQSEKSLIIEFDAKNNRPIGENPPITKWQVMSLLILQANRKFGPIPKAPTNQSKNSNFTELKPARTPNVNRLGKRSVNTSFILSLDWFESLTLQGWSYHPRCKYFIFIFLPLVGATIAFSVLVAAVITVAVVAARSKYDSPILLDDKDTTYKTIPKNIYVLKNDVDPKGGTLTITAVTQPPYGTVQILSNGAYLQYTPKNIGVVGPHYSGDVVFRYQAQNAKVTAWASCTITVLNHDPEPTDYSYTISKNSKNNIVSIQNDKGVTGLTTLDLDGDELTVNAIGTPLFGTATISADAKTIVYTPQLNFIATDTFSYNVTDKNSTAMAQVTFKVQNDAPRAFPDSFTVKKNVIASGLNVLANDVDPNGDALIVDTVRAVGSGNAFITGGSVTVDYYPSFGFSGGDSFEYSCSDGELSSASYVLMNIVNAAPLASPGNFPGIPKNAIDYPIPIIFSDTDPYETLTITIGTLASHGVVKATVVTTPTQDNYLTSDNIIFWNQNAWTITYTPATGYLGADSFTYTVSDGTASTSATVTLTVINTAPVAINDAFTSVVGATTYKQLLVLSNDYDPNSDLLFIKSVSGGVGNISISADKQSINYRPKAGQFAGTVDTFTYTISDIQTNPAYDLTATATVNVTLQPSVASVACTPLGQTVMKNTQYTWTVDTYDPNGNPVNVFLDNGNSPVKATVTNVGPKISFKSVPQRSGTYTLTYHIWNTVQMSNCTSTIIIQNQPPVANGDAFAFIKANNQVDQLLVLPNDVDPDAGDTIKITGFSDPWNRMNNPRIGGSVIWQPTYLNWTVNNSFVGGIAQVYYTIVDSDIDNPLSAIGLVNVTIKVPNPIVVADYVSTQFNTAGTIPISLLMSNDISPSGQVGGSDIVWAGLTPCSQLDSTYCGVNSAQQPTVSNGNVVVPYTTNSCKSNKFQYCIAYAFDPTATQCGTVTLAYTNCICIVPIDIVFVLDSSGSITNTNWGLMMDMLANIVGKLNLGANAINAAFVQFGSKVKVVQTLTSSLSTLNSKITWLRSNHMASSTATGDALKQAVTTAQATTRTPAYAKVIMLFTDGLCNAGTENPITWSTNLRLWQNGTYPTNPAKPVPWKLVAAGLGDQLYWNNNAGWNQVVSMNYDPALTMAASFNNLDSLVSQVVSATCNV